MYVNLYYVLSICSLQVCPALVREVGHKSKPKGVSSGTPFESSSSSNRPSSSVRYGQPHAPSLQSFHLRLYRKTEETLYRVRTRRSGISDRNVTVGPLPGPRPRRYGWCSFNGYTICFVSESPGMSYLVHGVSIARFPVSPTPGGG